MDSNLVKQNFFSHEFTVSPEETDRNGHVNNVIYLQWMQNIAIMHSDASGSTETVRASGCIWVVRAHTIEYLKPAFAGDLVEATTWVDKYSRIKANRQYRFLRKSDGETLAAGVTVWVFVDAKTRKPRTIPENVKACLHPEERN